MSKKCSFDIEKLRNYIRFGKTTKSRKWRYIPELDDWIQDGCVAKTLASLGMTTKEWFDKHFLLKGENGNSIIPVCETCGKPLKFYNLTRGYQNRYCCSKCTGIGQRSDEDFKKSHSDAAKKVWDKENSPYKTEEYRDKVSEGNLNYQYNIKGKKDKFRLEPKSKELLTLARYFKQKSLWADPLSKFNSKEYRDKLSLWVKSSNNSFGGHLGNNYSKISCELFDSVAKILVSNYGIPMEDIYYGKSEFKVSLSSEVKRYLVTNSKFFKLDFYIKSLNRGIEFFGDHWHNSLKRIPNGLDEDEYINQVLRSNNTSIQDSSRLAAISIELGMKDMPLVIWENDYRSDKSSIVNKCISYLLKGLNSRSKSDIWNEINNLGSEDGMLYPFEFYSKNLII